MRLTGLIAATYTPFREDGSVNLDLIPTMIDYMIESGVSGFYVCGSTGEGESMSVEERKQVAQASVSATKGRLPVVVQVGHNSVESACELARHAADSGEAFAFQGLECLSCFVAFAHACEPATNNAAGVPSQRNPVEGPRVPTPGLNAAKRMQSLKIACPDQEPPQV